MLLNEIIVLQIHPRNSKYTIDVSVACNRLDNYILIRYFCLLG
jgi:hypothetical protein